MSAIERCPHCGAELASGTGQTGVCPTCAFGLALDRGQTNQPTATSEPGRSAPSRTVGPYRLLEKIGEGGMGEVWRAEQTAPVRRMVALKLIKPGMDSRQVIARFEAERQALAIMNHPCVSGVLDAGTTDDGRPFFVMEYVAGVPITEHCDRERLTTERRLALFLQVCDGVQHAHQRAIIHRDLKPANILVALQDGVATPKIIDFGVAKATAQHLTERTLFTEIGVLIGTPEYMSPEQAAPTAQDVDTRSDVYALGVLLYELLVGALPFEPATLREAGFEGILRMIREVEPSRPSTRLTTLDGKRSAESAKHRSVDLVTLRRQVTGELDWITMKALEKQRDRRYGSPAELAADIGRHLGNEPVVAGPPGVAYRARKFVRRHRASASVATLAVLSLLGFAVAMGVQARRIATEREASDRVSEFLANMLGGVKPQELGNALWKDLRQSVADVRRKRGAPKEQIDTALAAFDDTFAGVNATDSALRMLDRQVLARATQTIDQDLVRHPRIAARLEQVLGETYLKLGLFVPAEEHAKRAVAIRVSELGANDPDTLQSQETLARVWTQQGRFGEAEKLLSETLAIRGRVLGDEHPATINSMQGLATAYRAEARYDEAEKLLTKVIEARGRVLGPDHLDTLKSKRELALLYYTLERYDESETLGRELLEAFRRAFGPEHSETLATMNNLGNVYQQMGRAEEAEAMHRQALELRRKVYGNDHPDALRSMNNLATALWSQKRLAEAESLLSETIEIRRRVLRRDHPDTLSAMHNLGLVYKDSQRLDVAENLFRETVAARERELGPGHPLTVDDMYMIGGLAALRKDKQESLRWLRRAIDLGYRDRVNDVPMAQDDNFNVLRGEPEFATLAARARREDGKPK